MVGTAFALTNEEIEALLKVPSKTFFPSSNFLNKTIAGASTSKSVMIAASVVTPKTYSSRS